MATAVAMATAMLLAVPGGQTEIVRFLREHPDAHDPHSPLDSGAQRGARARRWAGGARCCSGGGGPGHARMNGRRVWPVLTRQRTIPSRIVWLR
jgi:hypothetical protein